MSTLVKNQHYVWRHYLSPWATKNKVWCVRAPSKTAFQANLTKVGSETFFYRLHELDEQDLAYLDGIILQATSPGLQDVNRGWIRDFQLAFRVRRAVGEQGAGSAPREELDALLDKMAKTMGENYHASVETRGTPLLKLLRARDSSFYEDSNRALNFIEFITHQYFRTANMRNLMTRLPVMVPHEPKRTWPIESFIYATNVGSSLYVQRRDYKIQFLENPGPVPFIAGDQPIINLNGHQDEHLRLYYPLSPELALIYGVEGADPLSKRRDVSRLEVEAYNFAIHAKSDSQLYSNDRAYLEATAALPKAFQPI